MEKICRRSFIKKSLAYGAASMMGGELLSAFSTPNWGAADAAGPVDLSIVTGGDCFRSTVKAVEQLGGMKEFVTKQSKVGLLVNSPFKNRGAHVNPDIVLAVVKMCYDAGVKEIRCLKEEHDGFWRKSTLFNEYADEIKSLKPGWGETVDFEIPGALSLKDATVRKDLLECDVLINVFITKHHDGVHFSGALKNMMGASTLTTNLYMHFAGKKGLSWYADVNFLSRCIADLNLIRKPDLCISDSTEFISTNGPYGPGKILKPQKVVAGRDNVLVDAYCCTLLGLKADNVEMIRQAAANDIGKADIQKANILAVEI